MSCNDWVEVYIGDLLELNYGKSLPKNRRLEGNVPVYGSGGISGFHNEPLVNGPGIIIGRKGTVGSIYYEKKPFFPIDTTYYIVENQHYNLRFLYYFLQTLSLDKMNSHSAVPGLNRDQVYKLKVSIPPIHEQKRIADILSRIDDKIELNNEMNKTLEEMAQAIFKRWFVDFEFPNENGEPYKSSGGEFVLSESIKIPIGWKFRKLNEVVNIKYGKNLPTKNLLDNGFPVFGGNGKIGYFNEYLYEKPQVLVACRGAASGKVLTSLPYSFVTNNSLVLEYENGPLTFEYLKYYCLQNPFFQYVTGSAQPQITITNISNAPILIPNKTVLLKYSQIVKSIEEKILLIKKENKYLSNIRDTLLPKLMSGEIRVPVESD